jgi:hypothetical protein
MSLFRKIIAVAAVTLSGAACYRYQPTAVSKPPSEPSSIEAAAPPANDELADGASSQPEVPPAVAEPDGAAALPSSGAVALLNHTPAHDPPPAPARVYAPVVPSGRYENYGLFGRKTRWVSNQPQSYQPVYQPRYQSGCVGGNCGGRR